MDEAIREADAAGYVSGRTVGAGGSVTTTIDIGDGFEFDPVQAPGGERLGAGSDGRGTYVSFNSVDQNMIISGATFAISAGLCAVSAGAFCVVAGAVLTAATVATTSNGGVRCAGNKSLRVYSFAGGKVKPRCV